MQPKASSTVAISIKLSFLFLWFSNITWLLSVTHWEILREVQYIGSQIHIASKLPWCSWILLPWKWNRGYPRYKGCLSTRNCKEIISGKDYYKIVWHHSLVSEVMFNLWAFEGYLVGRSYNDSFSSLSVHLNFNIQGTSKKKDHVVFIEQVKNIQSHL